MNEINISRMIAMFSYSPTLGTLRFRSGARKGRLVGSPDRQGYLRVSVAGHRYSAHRIAWAMHYGEQPPALLDHINGDPTDNRIENLRPATHSLNAANMRRHKGKWVSRFKGVSRTPAGRFVAVVCRDGIRRHCGTFDLEEEAHAAYLATARVLFGEYANAGHRT